MGDRRVKALTRQFVDVNLVELTKKPIAADDDDPFTDWTDHGPIAKGSQNEALPVTARTKTLADPLTTGLLAEVARRTATVELDPSVIRLARTTRDTREIDPQTLHEALRDAVARPVAANTKPRR